MIIKNKFFNKIDTINKEDIPLDWWLERFRNWRAEELKNTDWTQLSDAPVNAQDWANYRQALRDLPALADFANVDLPERPI